MALSDTNKLNVFASEAYAEADRICGEIKSVMEAARNEKLQSGRKKLQSEIRESAAEETARMLKENALAVSRKNTELRQEYLRKIDSTSELVMDGVRKKLEKFTESDEYIQYLEKIAAKALSVYTSDMEIHHAERDAHRIEALKGGLAGMNIDVSKITFASDAGIKIGGLKFHPKGSNIQINETIDKKLDRSAETLDTLINEHVVM